MPVELRRARPADLDAIVGMRVDFERITRDSGTMDERARREELAALLGPDLESGRLLAWIAEDGGAPLGQAALRLRPRGEGELLNVYCRPEYRGRGVGAALVALAVAEARGLGLSLVRLQPTEDSRRIYSRAGFRADGRDMVLDLRRAPRRRASSDAPRGA